MREHRADLVVAGGFPCQDISAAGRGQGLSGARSGLWREFARIVREIRPGFVFVENSPMLVSRGLERVLGDLAACGYDAVWRVLAASDVGARHLRERIWIAAARHNRDEQLLREVAGVERGGWEAPYPGRTRQYPTPQAHDAVAGTSRPHGWGGAQRNLTDLAAGMQYPTPRAHDRLPGGAWLK
jgi:site-specific DNA-cytosine methylase